MKKIITIVLILLIFLIGCAQQPEPEPPQSYQGGGCGVAASQTPTGFIESNCEMSGEINTCHVRSAF